MKNLVALVLFVLAISFVPAKAQSSVGLFVGYGSEIEKASIGLNAEIFASPRFAIVPSGAYYLPRKEEFGGDKITTNFFELNADVHGYITKEESVGFYALFGFNYINQKVTFDPAIGTSESISDSETGANLGLGVTVGKESKSPRFYFEFKYETVGEGQTVLIGGFRFR